MQKSPRIKQWWINAIAFVLILTGIIAFREISIPAYDWIAGNAVGMGQTVSISPGVTFFQPFEAPKGNLSGLQIMFNKQNQSYPEDASVIWALASSSNAGTILAGGMIPVSEINNRELYTVHFAPIAGSAFQDYVLLIKSDTLQNGVSLGMSAQAQSTDLAYGINGNLQPGTLIFNMGFTRSTFSLRILLFELCITLVFWVLFLLRRRWWSAVKIKALYVTVPVAIFVAGLCFIVIEPPLQMYDEPNHFRRVWEVSTGTLVPATVDGVVSTRLPEYIQNTFNRISRIAGTSQNPIQLANMMQETPGDTSQLSQVTGQSTSYNFFAYLLSALFVHIGVLLGSSALGLIYLARLANLIQYTALTYWALRNAKVGKYTLAVGAMLGLMITQGTAINVDSLLFGGSFLFISSVMNLAFSENPDNRFSSSAMWGAIVGAVCILISKYVYFPMLVLALIIPVEKFGSVKKKTFVIFWSFLAAGVICLALQTLMPIGVDPRIDYSNISLQEQIAFMLRSPFNWPAVFLNTLNENAFGYFAQYIQLNQTGVGLGIFAVAEVILVLMFAWAESDSFRGKLTLETRLIAGAVIVTGLTFIMLPLYLTWTPVGAATVAGLQGRYFAPFILVALLFFKPSFGRRQTIDSALLVVSMSFLLINQLWATVLWFY